MEESLSRCLKHAYRASSHGGQTFTAITTTVHTGAAYLHYVALMNQVVMMGTQIYHDACDTQHHKYVAHQLALLYVSLCDLLGIVLTASLMGCFFFLVARITARCSRSLVRVHP